MTDVYFGSYTEPHPYLPHSRGLGIVVCTFDPTDGKLEKRHVVGGILNPSYLALDQSGAHLVAVSENFDTEGGVCVFRRRDDGSLTMIEMQSSGGRASCHVCVTASGIVAVSSYLDASLATWSFEDGKLGPARKTFRYSGSGVNSIRQDASHPHHAAVSPDSRRLYVCDLGADRIWCHSLEGNQVKSSLSNSLSTPPGSGPRHLEFHPTLPLLYVICELDGNLLTCDWDVVTGDLHVIDCQPSLPADWQGEPAAAAIHLHPSATALFVSNRNHDSLTAFQLDRAGRATFACCIPSGGKNPRDFALDPSGAWLLAVHHESDSVAIHSLDPATGLPTRRPARLFSIPTPACVLFA